MPAPPHTVASSSPSLNVAVNATRPISTITTKMNTFEDDLIELVKKYPVLYRTKGKNYKNMITKHNCWVKIGAELNKTPEECKSKFRNIRDNYIKNKKKKITGGAPSVSKYDDERLNFISEPYDEGEATNNDNSTNDGFIVCEVTNNVKEEYDSSEEVPLMESPFILGTTSTVVNTEQPNNYIPNVMTTSYDPNHSAQQNLSIQEQNLSGQEPNVIPQPRRAMKRKMDSIIDELKKDREERNLILQQLVTKATGAGQSPTHSFFSSMADIVCNFPPEKIAELRIRICNMVSDVELSVLRDRSQSGSRY